MKRGSGMHPARPDLWSPTKQPRGAAGGLIAAGMTHLSRREGVPPCLRTSPPVGGTHNIMFLMGLKSACLACGSTGVLTPQCPGGNAGTHSAQNRGLELGIH